MLTDVAGVRVGHAGDPEGRTGCTVVLLPEGTVGSCDVRGPAPGTRETALLAPDKPVTTINAILLTGGSAFGLAAADGVVRYLEERGIGHWTPFARVPIVPAAVVYDLFTSEGRIRPGPEMGYQACLDVRDRDVPTGRVGAGTGVTVGKWAGFAHTMPGGFGMASLRYILPGEVELVVAACAVTNCIGDVLNPDGTVLAGARRADGGWMVEENPYRLFPQAQPAGLTNTTLVVVATNAVLTKVECSRLAQRAHDGLARAIVPVHTTHDGDTTFAVATQVVAAPFDLVANLAVGVVEGAVRGSVK